MEQSWALSFVCVSVDSLWLEGQVCILKTPFLASVETARIPIWLPT